jgi:hypothetical protein
VLCAVVVKSGGEVLQEENILALALCNPWSAECVGFASHRADLQGGGEEREGAVASVSGRGVFLLCAVRKVNQEENVLPLAHRQEVPNVFVLQPMAQT